MNMKAIWKDTVLAESDRTRVVEGNHYFPPESLNRAFFEESPTISLCFWKGKANYLTVLVNGERNKDAAWTYRKPFPLARKIKGHVAFWGGIEIVR